MVDGEGCIAVVRFSGGRTDRYYYGVQVVIANNDHGVLDWVRSTWGGTVVAVKSAARADNSKSSWTWRCGTTLSRTFLTGLRPWLKIKLAQCDNALIMASLLQRSRYTLGRKTIPPEWLAEQEHHYWIQRELNHRGTSEFVRQAMHSPRKIARLRAAETLGLL